MKKLQLNELTVTSFVTLNEQNQDDVRGGFLSAGKDPRCRTAEVPTGCKECDEVVLRDAVFTGWTGQHDGCKG